MPSSDTVAHDHVMLQYLLTYPMFSNSIVYMPCDSVIKLGYMYIRDNLYKYFSNYSAKHILSTASISPILLCPTRYEGLAIPRLIGFWLLPGCTLVWYIDVPWLVGCHFKGRRERENLVSNDWLPTTIAAHPEQYHSNQSIDQFFHGHCNEIVVLSMCLGASVQQRLCV